MSDSTPKLVQARRMTGGRQAHAVPEGEAAALCGAIAKPPSIWLEVAGVVTCPPCLAKLRPRRRRRPA